MVVVPSRVVKALRTRYSLAGNKSDRSDAFMLADVLRTDGHRLRALEPDGRATRALRCAVRTRKELVRHRVALVQQLEAHLERAFPGGSQRLRRHPQPYRPALLDQRFPSQARADWLSRAAPGVPGSRPTATAGARTRPVFSHGSGMHPTDCGAPRPSSWVWSPLALVAAIEGVPPRSPSLKPASPRLWLPTPSARVFQCLPRSGTVRAAALLVEIGDCKARFPTPESLACLAGVAPSTRASGQHHAVVHRYVSDKWLKNALCDFAQDSRRPTHGPPTSTGGPEPAKTHHPQAVRVLARAWCYVIWRCWQDETPL